MSLRKSLAIALGWLGVSLISLASSRAQAPTSRQLPGQAPLAHEPGIASQAAAKTNEPNDVATRAIPAWLAELPLAAQRGYRHLTESVYLPADLDEEVFAFLIEGVEQRPPALPLGSVPAGFSEPRAATFLKYGLTQRPGDASDRPLQYVVTPNTESGSPARWAMNCFACHGGSVYGQTLPGAPNNLYQLQSFTEDVRAAKLRLSKPLTHMDMGSLVMPLGGTVGTTNAVMFGVALLNYRDADLNVRPLRASPHMLHHDMDAPPWWHFHRKRRLYADGFAEKGARGLMQFMLVRENGPEKFRAWESDFEDVYEFIDSVRPPRYPGKIDWALARQGQQAFDAHCARCHGSNSAPNDIAVADSARSGTALGEEGGENWRSLDFPEKLVPIDEIGTDRARLDSLTSEHRQHYGESWFAYSGAQETWSDPGGYMAPPLDGIWASAPYLHNGSVPTLWHLLHPEARPALWKRTVIDLDEQLVGLTVEQMTELPSSSSNRERRQIYDSRRFGKGNQGHDFPNELTEEQREAVLEFLKTL